MWQTLCLRADDESSDNAGSQSRSSSQFSKNPGGASNVEIVEGQRRRWGAERCCGRCLPRDEAAWLSRGGETTVILPSLVGGLANARREFQVYQAAGLDEPWQILPLGNV